MNKPMPRLSTTAVFGSFGAGSREDGVFAFVGSDDYSGCVWPQRTYTCSFCGREFRSAQALGGHMNVHRRDRARLKHNQEADHHENILEANLCHGSIPMNLREDSRKPDATKRENNIDTLVKDSVKNQENGEVRTDLTVGLNWEVCQKLTMRSSSCKRAKTDDHHDVSSRLPLMLELVLGALEPTTTISNKNINSSSHHHEELDLELRLGARDPQNVN